MPGNRLTRRCGLAAGSALILLGITTKAVAASMVAGDRPRELAWIGSAEGATSALIGFVASCDDEDCQTVRDTGQDILGLLARRKSALVGGSCGHGVLEGLTGCETTTAASYCSTDCMWMPVTGSP